MVHIPGVLRATHGLGTPVVPISGAGEVLAMILDDLLGTDEQILALSDDVRLAATVEFLPRYGPPPPRIQELSTRAVRDVLEGSPSNSAAP